MCPGRNFKGQKINKPLKAVREHTQKEQESDSHQTTHQ